jgi:uncharacterized protein (DUF486 family)
MWTLVLLLLSTSVMTVAWYGHLRWQSMPMWAAILLSWLMALPEYSLQVPGNRLGFNYYGFSTAQLKIFAEAFSLIAFVVFNYLYFQVKPNLQTMAAFGLIFAAVILIVWGQQS